MKPVQELTIIELLKEHGELMFALGELSNDTSTALYIDESKETEREISSRIEVLESEASRRDLMSGVQK